MSGGFSTVPHAIVFLSRYQKNSFIFVVLYTYIPGTYVCVSCVYYTRMYVCDAPLLCHHTMDRTFIISKNE